MVYQPIVQQPQQYGQPGQQPQQPYGVPIPQPYGAPTGMPGQPSMAQPAVVKWSGLSTGGAFKIPVIAFIGRLTDMVYDPQSQFGLRIIEKYDQVQILESPVPWPWATVDLSIKYSDREESGWGRHVGSAKSLGLAQNAASLDEAKAELVGKIYELRQKDESYGEDQKTGQAFHGDVWRFMRVVGIGGQAPQTFQPQPQYVPPAANATPGVPPVAAASQQPPVAQAIPVVAQPIPTTSFNAALNPSDTAPVRAKKLLHTRALNEFLGVALVDSVIKADPAFVNSIYDQSFILGLKASGQAVLGQDGKFAIVS